MVFLALAVFAVAGGTIAFLWRSIQGVPEPQATDVAEAEPSDPEPAGEPSEPRKPKRTPLKPRKPPKPIGQPIDLTDLAEQVSQVRALELRRDDLDSRLVSEEALADKISAIAFEEQDPGEVADTERLLIALRLATPDVQLASILEDLYREQILGLYVPEEHTLYVRSRGGGSPAERMTIAHEITHALQDQTFDLVNLQAEYEHDDDASLALLSLIEGDAILTQQLWAQRHLSADEMQDAAADAGSGDALARAPDYLRESLFFPYSTGGLFVAQLYREGGFDAVDAAFLDPPTSTEQIMFPDRYRDDDEPVKVTVEVRPGDGWRKAASYEFGAFDLDQLLQPLGDSTASEAADGWSGGAVRSWTRGNRTAVAAVLRFDSDDDAAQACAALPRWYVEVASGINIGDGTYQGDRDHFAFRCIGDGVHFALASRPETARKLTSAP